MTPHEAEAALMVPVVPLGAGGSLLKALKLRPLSTTCMGCNREIPAGRTWCSWWLCRNADDRHDEHDYLADCEVGDE